MIEGRAGRKLANALLKGSKKPYKSRPFAALHRVAHGNVDIAYVFRNAIEDRYQQALVGQHHSSADIVCRAGLPEYFRKKLGLSHG